ncbi:Na+/H+ antiporter [Recurvomyces mirabilis]|uniref:Na+/H+ antiporter n=1 Tax=Recurvomyces mirabilis TaxID=574656 RepID=A0AAE1C6J7_9PEZI|nr:Na+/H+ antiporter [Recurvomyces mirabilis]KAK5162196.1 Na+/H+ antiporter [Recurvomyces mirabilis]
MVWAQIDINKPHLVYIILGGFTSIFMLCSSIIKERLYIGEATVATLCGIIFGPHAANLIDPSTWGNVDQITLEFSRIVLVVQCFAVGVELPKAYMERHWRSVVFLLIPVMTFGWLITSLFIWGLFMPSLNWLDSLVVAACVTATDPVLASSVVGKGKFAKRVPKHLRDLLSAESGCNDGMAFPFIYLGFYIMEFRHEPSGVAEHWILYTILYECVFGAVYGVAVGYIARRLIRYAHEKDWVDRESFLVFYFVLALFCAGSGSILGIDDLLVGFACGVGFSNDGWFTEKTEESHVSNVIDLLINLAFFVYFGTIIPWAQFNAHFLNLDAWRFVVLGVLVILFRRIPIMMALKPLIPDVKTWREALFAGHFGPIGVGAIFVAILARGELESHFETTTPLAVLPEEGFEHWNVIEVIWPITCFLVIISIAVHGSSIAVFTLGKHINTLTLTMSYTQANETSWMERLPRIQSRSRSSMSLQGDDSELDEKDRANYPPGMLPPIGSNGNFLRRQKEEDNPSRNASRASSRTRSRRSRKWDGGQGPGGPISQSAIAPAPRQEFEEPWSRSDSETLAAKSESPRDSDDAKQEAKPVKHKRNSNPEHEDENSETGEIFEEGHETVYEDEEGNVLAVEDSRDEHADEGQQAREDFEAKEGRRLMHEKHGDHGHGTGHENHEPDEEASDAVNEGWKKPEATESKAPARPGEKWRKGMTKMSTVRNMASLLKRNDDEEGKQKPKAEETKKHGPARAYQYGNTIIVEDEDGEVIKKYDIPAPEKKPGGAANPAKSHLRLGNMSKMLGVGKGGPKAAEEGESAAAAANEENRSRPVRPGADRRESTRQAEEADDAGLRFTIATGNGRRMSKAEFIDQIRQMDPRSRVQVVEESDAPEAIKKEARKDAREQASGSKAAQEPSVPVVAEGAEEPEAQTQGHRPSQAALHPVTSNEEGELKLVNSNEEEVPFHDVNADLRKMRMGSPTGETAAERRRRQALTQPRQDEEDSEDDGTDRVPPPARAGPSRERSDYFGGAAPERGRIGNTNNDSGKPRQGHRGSEQNETAAERRRREGALGLREEPESDSEEEDVPRAAPAAKQGIRFADEAPVRDPGQEGNGKGRNTTLRWGRDVGR